MTALLVAGLLLGASPVVGATVTVEVANVRDARGHVLVAICPAAQFLKPHCAYQGRASSRAGITTVMVAGVPPGRYAAEAYQDADDNGKLDRTFLGLPAEGMGFSRDARMMFGPPSFGDAAFDVGAADVTIRFRLRYY